MSSAYTAIELPSLPFPGVVDEIDYETLLAARIADLSARMPEIADALQLESDPVRKLLEENAYRETLLRQRVNEAAKAVMLAYAGDADLDQIGANYDVERLLLDAGNPDAVPPVPPTYESDSDFRRRIQLSPEGYTTAGSAGSYTYHALSADADVKDAQPISPTPGVVTVYVLSRSANGEAGVDLLAAVNAAVNDQAIRPMTDQVSVQSAAITEYTVAATLTVYPGPDAELIRSTAEAAVTAYVTAQHRIGYDVTLSGLYAALHQAGVQNVELTSPAASLVIGDGEAAYCTAVNVTLGGTDV